MRILAHIESSLSAWGQCRTLESLPGGNRNAVLLVERQGERLVAKYSRRRREAIEWLLDVQAKAREAGFIVPELVASNDGRLQVGGVTVERWIDGLSVGHSQLLQVKPLVGKFHALTRGWPQRPGFASSLELLQVDRGGDVDLSQMPEELVAACRAAWRELEGERASVVHGDLNPSNLLVTTSGRFALLDWDETRVDVSVLDEAGLSGGEKVAQPHAQRALLAWEVAASWLIEPEYARRLASELLSGQGQ
jgi:Ser/Thr protein kinase RdoA (MazF antagonist)